MDKMALEGLEDAYHSRENGGTYERSCDLQCLCRTRVKGQVRQPQNYFIFCKVRPQMYSFPLYKVHFPSAATATI